MMPTHDLVHKAIEDFSARRQERPEDEKHWVSFTVLPKPFPPTADGLLVFRPSGQKQLFLGWHGHASGELPRTVGSSLPTLVGTLTSGKRVEVRRTFHFDECLTIGAAEIQLCAVEAGEVVLGEESTEACEARFRLINFELDEKWVVSKKPDALPEYCPSLQFEVDNLEVLIHSPSRVYTFLPVPQSEYVHGSELQLIPDRPVSVEHLRTTGWHLIRLLALASAHDVGYQDITFKQGHREWVAGYNMYCLPLHGTDPGANIGGPLTREYLPHLLKNGVGNIVEANKKFGMLLVLRHYIDAQHTGILQKSMTSLFQGYETCLAAYRSVNSKLTAVPSEDWDEAIKFLKQPDATPGVKKALEKICAQVKNGPTTKETLNMILKELQLHSDLSFWQRRQDMFHKGDIDRQYPVEGHVDWMLQADDLLARMLLRMVGYSGEVYRRINRHKEIGRVP
jgi:hypothetical protein